MRIHVAWLAVVSTLSIYAGPVTEAMLDCNGWIGTDPVYARCDSSETPGPFRYYGRAGANNTWFGGDVYLWGYRLATHPEYPASTFLQASASYSDELVLPGSGTATLRFAYTLIRGGEDGFHSTVNLRLGSTVVPIRWNPADLEWFFTGYVDLPVALGQPQVLSFELATDRIQISSPDRFEFGGGFRIDSMELVPEPGTFAPVVVAMLIIARIRKPNLRLRPGRR